MSRFSFSRDNGNWDNKISAIGSHPDSLPIVGIVPNLQKDVQLEFTKEVLAFCQANGCKPILKEEIATALGLEELMVSQGELYKKADFLVVLGGDGTLLHSSGYAALHDTPLIGINLGHLGYLTDVDRSQAFTALERVLKGDYILEKRMMLETKILSDSSLHTPLPALNDVCLVRGNFSKTISFELSINEEYIDRYRADGIILSTPTGSTAYNLAAGGPILKPDCEMIAVTPVCPHALHFRPAVISSQDCIKIRICAGEQNDCMLAHDGQNLHPLKSGDELLVQRSQYSTTIIKTNQLGFYDILRQKMVIHIKDGTHE